MLVPLSWLREFTPYEGDAQTLGDKLTMLGLEMDGILHPFENIKDIRVGYVARCEPHPDSDHLHCCVVDMGDGNLLNIVCGAPNVAQGQKVAVAEVGTRMPDGTAIKKAKLRGQPSAGMICSERELGLSEDHSGIMVLPETLKIGMALVDALEMEKDVLDLAITPNRPDCLSILGVARETAMAFGLPFHVPDLPLELAPADPDMDVPVEIADPALCFLYAGRVITGVKVEKSPMRMRYRLISVGVRPISNIVDVTNYILFECGQPLHSFDLDKLSGRRIIVRPAANGDRFVTLDGRERLLTDRDLCICDAEKVVGLAGVMGGLDTEITENSRNVFLEGAVFEPRCIRKTARRLGINSEASFRFERGVDQQRTILSLDRASALISSLGGGRTLKNFSVSEPRPFAPAHIVYHPARASSLLGVEIDGAFQKNALQGDGCVVMADSEKEWRVEQPSWRPDLTREADLVEEVGRIYGLDTIEPVLPSIRRQLDDNLGEYSRHDFWGRVKHWGAGLGLNEAVNYSFVGEKDLDFLNLDKTDRIYIFNPLSEDQNALRTCLAPSLLQDLANNLAFGGQSARLFELAKAFTRDEKSETGACETGFLGILLYGLRHEQAWPHKEEDFSYEDLKGILNNLFDFLHIQPAGYELFGGHPYLWPCVRVVEARETIGYLGRVKPEIAKEFHAQKNVWLAEINLESLRELARKARVRFRALPLYPSVKRDITVMAPSQLGVDDILEKILLFKMPTLEGAVLVDCFEPEGKDGRNLTFRLTFRHARRTLTDPEVDKEREKLAAHLRKQLNVEI